MAVEQIISENRPKEIPELGQAIEKKIVELVTTGHLTFHDKLEGEFPMGVKDLLNIPGVGPRTAMLLCTKLGIKSVDELETAILNNRVARLPHHGKKTA